jgi:hypothetical protein
MFGKAVSSLARQRQQQQSSSGFSHSNASMWCRGISVWFPVAGFVVALALFVDNTGSFTPSTPASQHRSHVMQSFLGNNEGQSAAQKEREKVMEMSSLAGARAIAKLDLEERTKRAMLAEVIEDRIFELVDELELFVAKNNGLVDAPETIRVRAMEMAKETKSLQVQYDDLVNGRPSLLLELDSIGKE